MKARTLVRSLVMVAATFAFLAVLSVSVLSAQTIKLKVADAYPATHYFVTQSMQPWMDRVVQLTNKKVEFQYYPSEQLGKMLDMLTLLKTGVAEITYASPSGISSEFPLHSFFMLPGLFGNTIEGTRVLHQMLKEGALMEDWTKKGIRPVFSYTIPTYEVFTAKRPVVKLEDFKGQKIRASSAVMSNMLQTLGAMSVTMPSVDLSVAMQRGTVDGTVFSYLSAKSYKVQEQAKFATVGANLSSGVNAYGILETNWQKLPADVREAMNQAADEIVASVDKYQDEETGKVVSEFEKAGVKINRLSADEKARWEQALAPLMDNWAKEMDAKGLPGKRVVDSYKKAKASMGR